VGIGFDVHGFEELARADAVAAKDRPPDVVDPGLWRLHGGDGDVAGFAVEAGWKVGKGVERARRQPRLAVAPEVEPGAEPSLLRDALANAAEGVDIRWAYLDVADAEPGLDQATIPLRRQAN